MENRKLSRFDMVIPKSSFEVLDLSLLLRPSNLVGPYLIVVSVFHQIIIDNFLEFSKLPCGNLKQMSQR